jgi:Uma2 family endonuclease
MAMTTARTQAAPPEYLRTPVPVHFPEAALVPESKRHLEQRTALYQILKLAFGRDAAVGSEQFVYWDPTDPRKCLSPDVFVRLGAKDELFRTWKVWERGAPDVAVEIVSASDESDREWNDKLERYRQLGVRELVRFDPEVDPPSLRVWDNVDGDLVERRVQGLTAPSHHLPGRWTAVESPPLSWQLRLSRLEGADLFPTPEEREREAAERAREAAEREREAAERARAAAERERELRLTAEARIRELEAELLRRQ